MADEILSFSADFAPHDAARWRDIARAALKGREPEMLARRTPDGLAMPVLGRETDFPSATDPLGLPGEAPFIRGGQAVRDPHRPWDIRQAFTHPDPAVTHAEILRDLERGVTSVEIAVDPSGEHGVAIATDADMARALDGVLCDIAPVALSCAGAAGDGLEAAAALAGWALSAASPETALLDFNLDPLGTLARSGLLESGLDAAFADTARLARTLGERFPLAGLLRADSRPLHEAGGGAVVELAGLIASGVDTLRRLEAAGLARAQAAPRLVFTLAVDAHYLSGMAKLRAARRLWARCLDAMGLPQAPMRLQAVSSARMLTRRDPWVNMLRGTAACFAAGVGGADIVTVRPFTEALGTPEELGRRVARNTQIIAQAESHLGRVADPMGGAWAMEAHAEDLARAAWEKFRFIEGHGGYAQALLSGMVQGLVAEDRAILRRQIATRRQPLTGTSSYPLLDEIAAPVAGTGFIAGADMMVSDALASLLPERADPAPEPAEADPLWPVRLAEPFQRLRDLADRRARRTGSRPRILAITLGPVADHTPRLDFVRHLFASGGLDTLCLPFDDALATRLSHETDRVLAVICGTDAACVQHARTLAGLLKSAGVSRVCLAGKPGAHEAEWRAAGIDEFIVFGGPAIDTLETAHAELGIH